MTKPSPVATRTPIQIRPLASTVDEIDEIVLRLRAERPGVKYTRTGLCEMFVELAVLAYHESGVLPSVDQEK